MVTSSQHETNKEAQQHNAQEKVPTRWWWLGQREPITRFTLWLVIWTALLFVGTILSAGVLLVTDNTLKETMKNGQRAHIGVSQITVPIRSELPSRPETTAATVTWENGGRTNTIDLVIRANCVHRADWDRYGFTFKGHGQPTRYRWALTPGSSFKFSACYLGSSDFNVEQGKSPNRGELFLFGQATYRDIFQSKEEAPHVTEFCARYYVDPTMKDHYTQAYEAKCDSHNCTDNDCPK